MEVPLITGVFLELSCLPFRLLSRLSQFYQPSNLTQFKIPESLFIAIATILIDKGSIQDLYDQNILAL